MKSLVKLYLFVFASLIVGCVSLPERVNEEFLKDMTAEEENIISTLEEKIIQKKAEKDEKDEIYKTVSETLKVEKQKVTLLEKERELLAEQKKLNELNENATSLAQTQQKINENNDKLALQEKRVKYYSSKEKYDMRFVELKQGELAVLVSELSYEKSLIAKKYQLKLKAEREKAAGVDKSKKEEPGFFDKLFKKDKDGIIDTEKYHKYYQKQKEDLVYVKKDFEESKKKFEKIKNESKSVLTEGDK